MDLPPVAGPTGPVPARTDPAPAGPAFRRRPASTLVEHHRGAGSSDAASYHPPQKGRASSRREQASPPRRASVGQRVRKTSDAAMVRRKPNLDLVDHTRRHRRGALGYLRASVSAAGIVGKRPAWSTTSMVNSAIGHRPAPDSSPVTCLASRFGRPGLRTLLSSAWPRPANWSANFVDATGPQTR